MSLFPDWQPVMGLEIHIQLSTHSKIFSSAPVRFGAEANMLVDWLDAGFPGTLPVLNQQAVAYAVHLGKALQAKIAERSFFERKHYIYPDLPKGYQITQCAEPIIQGGQLEITLPDGQAKQVRIHHAHLEEDAGRLLHDLSPGVTAVDLNRAGVPLIEIVSYPELYSVEEAVAYAKAMHTLVTWLGICDGNMQEGSFRIDANVSVRPVESTTLGTRCEIKNLNSFRFLERALYYEIDRHISLYTAGERLCQETRLYDVAHECTRFMRYKERETDYRYFPDPDLPPLCLSVKEIDALAEGMPILPAVYREQYLALGLKAHQCDYVLQTRAHQQFFEALCHIGLAPVIVANWMAGEIANQCHEHALTMETLPFSLEQCAYVLQSFVADRITAKGAKTLLRLLCSAPSSVVGQGTLLLDQWIVEHQLAVVQDTAALEQMITEVLSEQAKAVAEYRAGKEKAFHALFGAVMKKSAGRVDPVLVRKRLLAHLSA